MNNFTHKKIKRYISRFLITLILVMMSGYLLNEIVSSNASVSSVPTPRTKAPSVSNKFYKKSIGGYKREGYGNCTWYAYCRAYEYLGKEEKHLARLGNADNWYENYTGEKGKKPRVGSILCVDYKNPYDIGHVAFVEKVDSKGKIFVSNMGYRKVPEYGNNTKKSGNLSTGILTTFWLSDYNIWTFAKFQGFLYLKKCSHSWNATTGKCTKCGTYYYDADESLGHVSKSNTTSIKGNSSSNVYKLATGTTIYYYPNTGADHRKTFKTPYVKVIGTLNSGSWYKIYYLNTNGNFKYGYVQSSKVSKYTNTGQHSVTFSDFDSFTVSKGGSHAINVTVNSTYPIYKVSASFTKEGSSTVSKSVSLTLSDSIYSSIKAGSFSNFTKSSSKNPISKLDAGQYTMKITATDVFGNATSGTKLCTVNNGVKAPTWTKTTNTTSGKKIVLKQHISGGKIKYSFDGGSYTTKSLGLNSTVELSITKEGITTVRAKSVSSAGKSSVTRTYRIAIEKLAEPAIESEQTGTTEQVRLSSINGASIKYKIDDGTYIDYKGGIIELAGGETIYAYATKNGYKQSEIGAYTAECVEPAKPVLTLANDDDNVAVGKTVTINWENDKAADSYLATLYQVNGEKNEVVDTVTTELTTASFLIPEANEYFITVIASNEIGDSEESEIINIKGRMPLKVVFKDASADGNEGTTLFETMVSYGECPEEVVEPEKRGHTFEGWMNISTGVISTNEYLNFAVKHDTTYVAKYSANKYKVKIYNFEGTLIETQIVAYDDAVDFTNAENKVNTTIQTGKDNNGNLLYVGYKLSGWQVTHTADGSSLADTSHVDSDMEVHAVANWSNPELPVITQIESAKLDVAGKYVNATIKVYNKDDEDLSFYLIVALKAKDSNTNVEKTVYTDRKIVYLDAKTSSVDPEKTVSMKIRVTGKRVNLIETAAVQCNEDLSTGSAYSQTTKANITRESNAKIYTDWTDWTTFQPAEVEGREIETGKEYRYRDKETITSGKDEVSGYTKLGTEILSTTYGNWSTTAPSTGTTITDVNKTVISKESKTAYKSYAYYCDCKKICWSNNGGTCKYCGGKTKNLLNIFSSVKLSSTGYSVDSSDKSYILPKTISLSSPGKFGTIYCMYYGGKVISSFTTGSKSNHIYAWKPSTIDKTVYRTKTVVSKNTFWKWGEWSDWSLTEVIENSQKEINTRTVYRYRDEVPNEESLAPILFDEEDKQYSVEGKLNQIDSDLNGKVATIMVYQANNTDPNKYQMQYLGQTTLGTNNSYNFTFVPKDKLSFESGNYIVALGVQGTTGLITVKVLEAEKPRHSVKFYFNDGTETHYIGEEQRVTDGEDADMSDINPPEREGFYFAGWNNRTTNITSSVEIEAIYVPIMNSVVFVDWVNQTIETQLAKTGDYITVPGEIEDAEGHQFVGWRINENSIIDANATIEVTGNMIIEAEFNVEKYTVNFTDYYGNIINTQNVEYGKAANPPAYSGEVNGGTFVSWSTENNWWSVVDDVNVRPIIIYSDTAVIPLATEVETEDGDRNIEITSEQENARIFYTTNGEEPTEEDILEYINNGSSTEEGGVKEYTGEIPITEDLDIIAVSYDSDMNISDPLTMSFEEEPVAAEDDCIQGDWQTIGTKDVQIEPGQDIEVKIMLEENPELLGYDILVSGDKDIFYADTDEYNEPIFISGDATLDGDFESHSGYEGWENMWCANEKATTNGTLCTLKLHVDEDVESGIYPIDVFYSTENTFNNQYDEVSLQNAKIKITSVNGIDISNKEVHLSKEQYVYDGNECKPTVTIDGLTEGVDFIVSYENNTAVGTGRVIVTGINDYCGQITKEFLIKNNDSGGATGSGDSTEGGESSSPAENPQEHVEEKPDELEPIIVTKPKKTAVKKIKALKKAFTVTWNRKDVDGYQIQYSTLSNFKKGKNTKQVNISKGKTVSKKITKLKSKKKYYVRIRTYNKKLIGKRYSAWCKAKSVRVK